MKKKLLLFIATFCFLLSHSQTVFWTEAFSNSCASACLVTTYTAGPNGAWTQTSTGTNDPESNKWYVSGSECGNAATQCGTSCGATDPSLHIGANDGISPIDPGASYNAGGLCPTFACVVTNMRAESPVINCSGQSNITLAFNYIENGDGANDDAALWYFEGVTWAQLDPLAKSNNTGCPAGKGKWTAFSIALPASANNNPNVKIGFNWKNNDDAVGNDPSFAVDDITLSVIGTGIVSPADLDNIISVYAADGNILIESSLPFRIMSVTDVLGKKLSATVEGNKIKLNESGIICFVSIEINERVIVKKVFVKSSNK